MAKTLVIAFAALLLMARLAPANAGVLYSLSGVVGDSHWQIADPDYNQPHGSLDLLVDLDSVFQANGGPGGLIIINFSGPAVLLNLDQLYYEVNSLTALCIDKSGCVNGDGYAYLPFRGGNVEDCCLSYPIDSSLHVQDLEIPPFAPYQASFMSYTEGNDGYFLDRIVGPDAIGQPFSLTVTTVGGNSVPEPASIADFGAALMMLAALYLGRRRGCLATSPRAARRDRPLPIDRRSVAASPCRPPAS